MNTKFQRTLLDSSLGDFIARRSIQYDVHLNGQYIMFINNYFGENGSDKRIVVNHDYLNSHQEDAMLWTMIALLLDEGMEILDEKRRALETKSALEREISDLESE